MPRFDRRLPSAEPSSEELEKFNAENELHLVLHLIQMILMMALFSYNKKTKNYLLNPDLI